MHSAEEYERRILEMCNIASKKKKNKNSSNCQGVECVTFKDSLSRRELQSVKQKSTPYPMARKIKLSSKPTKNQKLFSTREDDNESNENMEEYDYETWCSPSNTPQRSDKKNQNATETLQEHSKRKSGSFSETFKNCKQSLKRQATPNTHQRSDKKNQNATETLQENSKRKSVSFSETSKNCKQSLKQQATPYHPTSKQFKKNTCGDVKQVLFQVEIESSSDNSSPESFSDLKLTKKPCLSKSKNEVSRKNKPENKHTRNKKCVSNDNYLDMNVTELICDKEKYETTLTRTDFLWPDGHSDSEYSQNSEEFAINNSDCSNSIVDRNTNIDTSLEIIEPDQENLLVVPSDDDLSAFETDISEDVPAEVALDASEKSTNINAETGPVDYFSLKNALLIVLQNNSKLYFHGFMTVKVLYGKIEILGYTLTSSNESVDVFSPRGSSFLYFATNNGNKSTLVRNGFPDKLYNLGMDSESVKKLYQNFKTDSTVILCNEINKVEIAFMRKHISQQLYPKCENKIPQCVFQNEIGSWDVLKCNTEWDVVVKSNDVFSKTLICGGKGVGKSTMLRYMINRLLMEHPRILVIDLDPGQPEFTLPGCISVTIITEPVFGPNYTHLRKPHRCLFVPNVNVLHQLDRYLNSVKQLILSCTDFPKMPTLINYMGFTRGYGLEIFSAVVAYTQPTSIIQIKSSVDGRNFRKQLTYELILDTSKTLAPETQSIPHFDIITVSSMAGENTSWRSQPRQIREMCVLSYLGKILPEDVSSLTEKEVPVIVIDLSDVTLLCNDKIVPPAVVNASLVALCYLKTGNCVCLGWGVVRGIDLSTNKLFLITPVCPKELEQVDHLILGSVALPPSVYMTSDKNSGLTPHILEGELISLGQIPKRSKLPPNSN